MQEESPPLVGALVWPSDSRLPVEGGVVQRDGLNALGGVSHQAWSRGNLGVMRGSHTRPGAEGNNGFGGVTHQALGRRKYGRGD